MTNRDGGVTYTDKQTKEEKNLPGYNQVNSLSLLVLGKDIGDLEVEEKTLNIYDFDAKKDVPTSCKCFVDLHKEKINVAIQKQTVDKTKKNESTGDYDATGETRDVNEFIKFFPEGGLFTLSEIKNFVEGLGGDFDDVLEEGDLDKAVAKMGDEAGAYATTWLDKNRHETWDRSTGKKKKANPSKVVRVKTLLMVDRKRRKRNPICLTIDRRLST
ncbi:single strand DNA binding protein [Sulfitobacter phage phiCB2047-B]|uniref:Uncharacterized protein n=1 Tax=Sulfitobacter phage phiCB2047-B TaxID=754046 RepID=M4PQL9_9CAUD|nr:single strand DNA binding protein [Sulfitobacter phage phiCB2047-B]AGH07395.1 hypothetical protein SUFG_00023 [Sulfitobacter phage phiCB2047-B]